MEEGETDEILECTPKNVLRIFAEARLSCNLRVLGSQLGLKTTHLNEIERLPNDQRTMTIVVRRSRSLQPLTWPLLVSVLRKPALKEYSAADYIERRCCPTDGAMMSPVSDSPSSDTSRFLLQRSLSSSTSSQEASVSSHGTDLTIPNVVNEIADVSNWGELGIFLDLDSYDIERIRDNYDPSEHHQRLIENWFACDPQRSWEKLHRAMEDASARRGSASSSVASSMASFHSRSPVTPTSPTGTTQESYTPPQGSMKRSIHIDPIVLQYHDTDHPSLYEKLKEHSYKWKEIGTLLGFRPGELNNIEARPLLLSGAPKSWLSAMLAEWLQWAPGDARGSTDFATLDGLRQALDKAGLSATALALQ